MEAIAEVFRATRITPTTCHPLSCLVCHLIALFPGGNIFENGAHHPIIVGCYLFGRVGSLLLQPPDNRIDKQSRDLGWDKAVLYNPRGNSLLTSQAFEQVSQALLHHPRKIGA